MLGTIFSFMGTWSKQKENHKETQKTSEPKYLQDIPMWMVG